MWEQLQCQKAPASYLSVLERQTARLKWQQHQSCNNSMENLLHLPTSFQDSDNNVVGDQKNDDPLDGLGNGWPDLPTLYYPIIPGAAGVGDEEVDGKATSRYTTIMKKKRIADNSRKVVGSDAEKRMKVDAQGAAALGVQQRSSTRETSRDRSKDNYEASGASAPQKPDCIHVRARRGQATDSHSLAERVRRERISERMKYLQDLVPGCDKITNKASALDEIINYIQSLQIQVEFLSMKLASGSPRLNIDTDNFFSKSTYLFSALQDDFHLH